MSKEATIPAPAPALAPAPAPAAIKEKVAASTTEAAALEDPALEDPALEDPALEDPALEDPALAPAPEKKKGLLERASDFFSSAKPSASKVEAAALEDPALAPAPEKKKGLLERASDFFSSAKPSASNVESTDPNDLAKQALDFASEKAPALTGLAQQVLNGVSKNAPGLFNQLPENLRNFANTNGGQETGGNGGNNGGDNVDKLIALALQVAKIGVDILEAFLKKCMVSSYSEGMSQQNSRDTGTREFSPEQIKAYIDGLMATLHTQRPLESKEGAFVGIEEVAQSLKKELKPSPNLPKSKQKLSDKEFENELSEEELAGDLGIKGGVEGPGSLEEPVSDIIPLDGIEGELGENDGELGGVVEETLSEEEFLNKIEGERRKGGDELDKAAEGLTFAGQFSEEKAKENKEASARMTPEVQKEAGQVLRDLRKAGATAPAKAPFKPAQAPSTPISAKSVENGVGGKEM